MQTQVNEQHSDNETNGKRKKLMSIAAAVFASLGVIWAAYWFFDGRYFESTDDAYVAGNVVMVTSRVNGTVVTISVDDTDHVNAGDILVSLDESDASVALDQAKAELAQTVRQVRSLFTTNASLEAKVKLANSNLAKAKADLERRRDLTGSGAVSIEELSHTQTAVRSARADLQAAKDELSTNKVFTENTTLETHPAVLQAAAKVHEAYLALARTKIPAAVNGQIAKRSVQVGQRVSPGAPLMAIVPLDHLWVDANFKEGQVAKMHVGQPVTLLADVYGSDLKYHGKVAGIEAGTGSAFSLLPAQNATGNWIKVVQRVPVRIELKHEELKQFPLRIGLSMNVTVDLHDQHGEQLTSSSRVEPAYETNVFGNAELEAAKLIRDIIQSNRGDFATHAVPNDQRLAAKSLAYSE